MSSWIRKMEKAAAMGLGMILTLPASLTMIESQAFADLTNVEAARIPATVTAIAPDAFSGSNITILAPAGSYAADWAGWNGGTVLFVPSGRTAELGTEGRSFSFHLHKNHGR